MTSEKRDRIRVELKNLALAKVGDEHQGGVLKDISSCGTVVDFIFPPGEAEHGYKAGDTVKLDIDGIGVIKGKIVRLTDKGIAVDFIEDAEQEDDMITKIMAAINESPANA